uniref:Uncharacterized protein n=1 Tax=Timema bartmani TaxID=61472 RepID=A0A7R9ERL5_9NEOP|nr:unnamed protein product [Timema bartmani]
MIQSDRELITTAWQVPNVLVDLTGRPDGGVLKLDRTRYRHDPYARYTGTSVKLPIYRTLVIKKPQHAVDESEIPIHALVDRNKHNKSIYGEQHVDLRESCIKRDNDDVNKLQAWLDLHDPSSTETTVIVSRYWSNRGNCSTSQCSCKKSGLACTQLCKVCEGLTCLNTEHEEEPMLIDPEGLIEGDSINFEGDDPFSFEAVDKLDNSLQTEFLDLKYDCEAKIIFKQSGYELVWDRHELSPSTGIYVPPKRTYRGEEMLMVSALFGVPIYQSIMAPSLRIVSVNYSNYAYGTHNTGVTVPFEFGKTRLVRLTDGFGVYYAAILGR